MKKFIKILVASLLCVMLAFSVCACGNTEGKTEDTTAASETSTENETRQTESKSEESTQPATETEGTAQQATESATTGNSTGAEMNSGDVNTPGAVGSSDNVAVSYFDDVAFVGDSVSLKLSYYAAATGCLGNAQFFTAGSLGAANALWTVSDESVHPSYQGKKMLVEDCVAASGASKVYIMLGMNDIGLYGIDDTIKNYETLVNNIIEKSPEIQVVVQSMTPMTSTSTILGSSLNNENIKIYNSRLSDLCAKKGWAFVDVASVMYDAQGVNLNREYCSDPDGLGVHFTEAGCEKWVEYLSTHTP